MRATRWGCPPMALAMYSASLGFPSLPAKMWVRLAAMISRMFGDNTDGDWLMKVHLRSVLPKFLRHDFGLCFQHRRVGLELVQEQMKRTHRPVEVVGEAPFLERGDHFSHDQSC